MKVLIIDDESLARDELKYLLKSFRHVDVIGEAENIDQAYELILERQPDCLLLDINMPNGDGFTLLEKLTYVPNIIFTTAYEEYALKAFQAGAVDYLVKPIDSARLSEALSRVSIRAIDNKNEGENSAPLALSDKVFVKDNDRCWLVEVAEINLLETVGNYVRVYFDGFKPLIKRSLSQLESRLPNKTFIRLNRQVMVNLDFIKDIDLLEGSVFLITCRDGQKIETSRRQALELKKTLSL